MNSISLLLLLVISWQCSFARSLENFGSNRTSPREKEVPVHDPTNRNQGTVSVVEKSAEVYPIKRKTLSSDNSTSISSINATNTIRWIQYGHPRSATTLQFQTLCFAMMVKHLSDPKSIRNLHCNYMNQVPAKGQIGVFETHQTPDKQLASENFVVFATSSGDRTSTCASL